MKRLFTLIPVLVFCLLCAPAALADTVKTTYLDQNGNLQTCDSATVVTDAETTWSNGWYVVQNDVDITGNITVTGDVNLILENNCKLTVDGSIAVNKGNSFTVYSQSIDTNIMGELDVTTQNASHYAAIGGGSGNDAGTVNIYGGNVDATSKGPGAAIGGAWKQSGDAGTVNIYGGNVTATTGGAGAAIGGGYQGNGGIVTISGGTVSATNSGHGAAIGGSQEGQGCTVTISGGNVIATIEQGNGAAIGGANGSGAGAVNIYGGKVYAAAHYGAAIGGGMSDKGAAVNIYGGAVEAYTHYGAAIGSGESGQGGTVTISGGNVTAKSLGTGAAIGGGEGGQGGTVTISDGIVDAYSAYDAAIGSGKSGNGATVNISGGTVTAYNTNNNDAVNGTVTINPAGQAIKVLAGNSESDNQQLEGSPFTKVNEITSLLTGKHWFHSEVTSIQLVTGITLDPTTLTLKLGDTTTPTLTATVAPANATNPVLRWTSNNDAVVTVDAGTTRMSDAVIITAKAPGTAVITAEATDGSGVKASCTVTVEAAPVSTETPAPTKAPSPTEVPSPTKAPDSTTSSNNSTSSVSATPTATPVPVAQNHTVSTAATAIPQTGDESNPALWLGLLAVSALALGGLAFYKYKHRK